LFNYRCLGLHEVGTHRRAACDSQCQHDPCRQAKAMTPTRERRSRREVPPRTDCGPGSMAGQLGVARPGSHRVVRRRLPGSPSSLPGCAHSRVT
jgi:hypothetical protein